MSGRDGGRPLKEQRQVRPGPACASPVVCDSLGFLNIVERFFRDERCCLRTDHVATNDGGLNGWKWRPFHGFGTCRHLNPIVV